MFKNDWLFLQLFIKLKLATHPETMAETPKVISICTASIYRREIATGKGLVGSGNTKKEVILSDAVIEQRKRKLAAYDAFMAARGRTRTDKWAKQLQSTTNDIKKDTTKLVATTQQIDERTKATHAEVEQLKEQLAAYAKKVHVNTQSSPNMIRIVTEMTGPSVPVKIPNAILKSEGASCPGSKQDKAAFLGERFEGQENKLRDIILEKKNLYARGMPVTEEKKKRMEKRKSTASKATGSTAAPSASSSDSSDSENESATQVAVKAPEPEAHSTDFDWDEREKCIERQREEKRKSDAKRKAFHEAQEAYEQASNAREARKQAPKKSRITDEDTGLALNPESDEENDKPPGDIPIQMIQPCAPNAL